MEEPGKIKHKRVKPIIGVHVPDWAVPSISILNWLMKIKIIEEN